MFKFNPSKIATKGKYYALFVVAPSILNPIYASAKKYISVYKKGKNNWCCYLLHVLWTCVTVANSILSCQLLKLPREGKYRALFVVAPPINNPMYALANKYIFAKIAKNGITNLLHISGPCVIF